MAVVFVRRCRREAGTVIAGVRSPSDRLDQARAMCVEGEKKLRFENAQVLQM